MATGLADKIADFLSDEGFGDKFDGVTPVIFVEEEPADPDHVITVLGASGQAPLLTLVETEAFEVRVRHPSAESCLSIQRDIYELLQENGGAGTNNPDSQGDFGGIPVARITADFPAVRLGRDRDGVDGRFRSTQTFTALTRRFSFS